MKIAIAYPPINSPNGCPTIGQNRQFQYFKEPTYIYPIVPASAATLLRQSGHEVIWLDGIAQDISQDEFFRVILSYDPELILLETKTPIIKHIWEVCAKLKKQNPNLKTALCGDHATALPEESMQKPAVDFVLTGGDYDFLLLNLCETLSKGEIKQQALEPGIYYRQDGMVKNTGCFQLNHDLDSLPFIDRKLTRWQSYAYRNGNYKRTPGTYIMGARDCWWGQCTFCSWPTLYPNFRTRSVDNVLNEIEDLISRYQVREIMDDSGCFPAGDWLRDFCRGVIRRGINKQVYLDCNLRFGALSDDDFAQMSKANFRLLLFGLESANQKTLDLVNKNVTVEKIIEDCISATRAGLYPHITVMFGYPWETYADALKTLKLGKWLLRKGYAYTMQATIVIPYPGTKLFSQCKARDELLTLDWDAFDMKSPVMRSSIPKEKLMHLVRGMYSVSYQPEFILRKLMAVRDMDDLAYYGRAAKKVMGHIFDFKRRTAVHHN